MKMQWIKSFCLGLSILSFPFYSQAQLTESGHPITASAEKEYKPSTSANTRPPMNDICVRKCNTQKRVLAYPHLEERDVMWEKRIWREVHLSERFNHHFAYVKKPLISVLLEEAKAQNLILYSPLDDQFSTPMSVDEIGEMWGSYDTITVFDPETYTDSLVVVYNELNPMDVQAYRIKEVWFFDSKRSRLDVRILGIAPIANRYDEEGRLIASMPLFWVYYPDARSTLIEHETYDPFNGSTALAWDDVFEARIFHGVIVKESNIYDRRIQDYASGMNALLEAEKIHESIRNYEHDLWSY